MRRPDPFPNPKSKTHQLLAQLLLGYEVDTVWAMYHLNLQTPNARVSELRRVGWPIRSVTRPHPNPALKDENVVAYLLDKHFLNWMRDNKGAHPAEYPSDDGRGKFPRKEVTRG